MVPIARLFLSGLTDTRRFDARLLHPWLWQAILQARSAKMTRFDVTFSQLLWGIPRKDVKPNLGEPEPNRVR